MSWLGNGFREESKALADAYAQMYAPKEEQQQEEEKVEKEELKEATYPSDFINPDGSKRAVAKKKDGRPRQDDQEKDAAGRRKTVDEGKDPIKYALEADKKLMKLHTKDKPAPKGYTKEEAVIAAMKDAYEMMYEKKSGKDKCGEGTYWDSEEKKCKSKKKSGGGGRAIFYGGHSHSHDDDDDNDGGSDAGAAGDAAGGGGGGE